MLGMQQKQAEALPSRSSRSHGEDRHQASYHGEIESENRDGAYIRVEGELAWPCSVGKVSPVEVTSEPRPRG